VVTTLRQKQRLFPETSRFLLICLGLAAAVFAVYGQTWDFAFTTYDDNFYVTENPVVQQGLTLAGLRWAFTTLHAGAWMPVNWLTHLLDFQLFGLWAGGHHLVNVGYHLANTLLLFLLFNRLTGQTWRSGLLAALFALHPLHVESVAWIAERRDVLSTFWWLLTMLAYLAWVKDASRRGYFLVLICFTAGLLVKATPVTLPLVLLLCDFWPLRRLPLGRDLFRQFRRPSPVLLEKIPLLLIAVGISILTMIAVDVEGSLGSSVEYPWSFRCGNALIAYARYLYLTIRPVGLIPYYPYHMPLPAWQVVGSALLLAAISWACYRFRARFPYLVLGWFWFIITLVPVIGLIQQGFGFALADRYTYVPLIGIFIMVVWGGADLAARLRLTAPQLGLAAGVILVALMALSFQQVGRWRDTSTLFSYTITEDPNNLVALSQLGVQARDSGNYPEAYRYLTRAEAWHPGDYGAQGNLAKLLWLMGRRDEALGHYSAALKIQPQTPGAYLDIGIIKAEQGDFPGATDYLKQALALNPGNLEIRMNLALLFYQQKQYDAAGRELTQIIRDAPGFALAYNGLGLVSLAQGKKQAALTALRAALQIDPGLKEARDNLPQALALPGPGE